MTTIIRHPCATAGCASSLELAPAGHLPTGWVAATCPGCRIEYVLRKGELVRVDAHR